MLRRILGLVEKKKTVKVENFFDYPSKEKKKIIKEAAVEAAKMKRDTLKRYDLLYSAT